MYSLFLNSHHPVLSAILDVSLGWFLVSAARMLWSQFHVASLLNHVPGPKPPSWLWGSEWHVHESVPGVPYIRWKQQYGDVVKYKGALGRNMLAISDYRAATYILGEHVFDFPKPQGAREWFRLLVGEGLLVVEGKEAHARQRRSFSPALHQQSIRPLLDTFYALASKMADTLSSRIDDAQGEAIEEDVQWWANRFSLDSIGLAGFSYDFKSISGSDSSLVAALESLTNASHNFSSFVMKALVFTFPSILKIPSEKGKYIRNTREELGKVATQMWNEAKAANADDGKTLMSLMMRADREAGTNGMSPDEIPAQLRTLVQAGYEPVGCTVAWILYELAAHPESQARVREEVTASAAEPSYDALLERVPYLDAVLKECLRLHPAIIELTHVSAKDHVVPLSKPLPGTMAREMVIPRGTVINIPVNILDTDPEVWGADAADFRPERWLEMEADKKEGHVARRKELFAFSFGPRKCPGRQFALIEMKALVAILLRQFNLSVVPDKPIEPFMSFVIRARVQGRTASELPLRISKITY
ncbi:cytochrome P450 [Gautieria morchelliformis]|nr:cytochrome P450 [Gautieria morchelliformis]KAF8519954.1 cytochrome P450 [Gautieria morchelliformis]